MIINGEYILKIIKWQQNDEIICLTRDFLHVTFVDKSIWEWTKIVSFKDTLIPSTQQGTWLYIALW